MVVFSSRKHANKEKERKDGASHSRHATPMDGAKCPHLDRKNSELGDVVAAAIAEFYSWTEARRSVGRRE
jgi:hypothetical protein